MKLFKKWKIRLSNDYGKIIKKGVRESNRSFILFYHNNAFGFNRYGVVESKKMIKKAVLRKRIKRRVKEIIRVNRKKIVNKSFDYVFLPKKSIKNKDFHTLKSEILDSLNSVY